MRIKKLRRDNKYTIGQLAEYLGMTVEEYNELEGSEANMNLTVLGKLSSLYGCGEDYKPPKITVNADTTDLGLISKLNTINANLRLLRQLEAEQ